MAYLESGDIDGWMTEFANNAVYRWNNFDSLAGKAAIIDIGKKEEQMSSIPCHSAVTSGCP